MNEADKERLAAIRAEDAALHYCATCNQRRYGSGGDETDPHNFDEAECNRRLIEQSRKAGKSEGRFCWSPEDHHPFVEGDIPDYLEAESNVRFLLSLLDGRE